MADENSKQRDNPLEEDSIASKIAGGEIPAGLAVYVGLLTRGSSEGRWRLYLDLGMTRSLECRDEDIVHSEKLPADQSPFGSLGGTRVYMRKGAEIIATHTVSRSHSAGAEDEFDLDIRLGGTSGVIAAPCFGTSPGTTCAAECGGGGTGAGNTCLTCASCGDTCFRTCDTCRTLCDQATCDTCGTCNTCRTQCGQATCQTCQTRCQQATCRTCQTCQTQCGQATCQTCRTRCGQPTCQTCRTVCDTCPLDTCQACTHVTCFNTCPGGFC
jgi:hypothetical protein